MRKISARDYFRGLCFVNANDAGATNLNFAHPVFTNSELTNEPLKWLKYVLLGKIGLRPLDELDSDIKRFKINHKDKVQLHCKNLLDMANQKEQNVLLVLKLVPMDFAGQLPNFRITSIGELPFIFTEVHRTQNFLHNEIWVCESITQIGNLNFAGRYILPNSKSPYSLIESLWYTSPRLLETVSSSPSFPYPYLRAKRLLGALSYQVEDVRIPTKYLETGVNEKTLLGDFAWLLNKIYSYQEKISELEAILVSAGANEVSLEFKSDNGNFRFIDWDTEVETGGWIIGI